MFAWRLLLFHFFQHKHVSFSLFVILDLFFFVVFSWIPVLLLFGLFQTCCSFLFSLWLFTFVFGLCYLFISLLAFTICSLLLFTSTICFAHFYCLFHLFVLLVLIDCFDCSLQLFISTIFGLLLLLFVANNDATNFPPPPFLLICASLGRASSFNLTFNFCQVFFNIRFFQGMFFLVVWFF